MSQKGILIQNAKIFTEKSTFRGSVRIEGEIIAEIFKGEIPAAVLQNNTVIDASDLWLLPGVIDTHVHFREPGLTQKADLHSESRAALAGGVTTFFDMPNTLPQTVTLHEWEQKCELASQKSLANYAFFIGASAQHKDVLKSVDPRAVPGIKLYLGASTGNMQIDDQAFLQQLFAESPLLLMAHCEDNAVIARNLETFKARLGDDIPVANHPLIRSAEACYRSTAYAVEMAMKYHTRLHVAHVSTANELALFDASRPLAEKQITAEGCMHYFWFDQRDYERLGARIKCNPAIKTEADKKALIQALNTNRLDTVASDHAPHLLSDKEGGCLTAASGIPLVQHALPVMLQLARQGNFTVEKVLEKMCYAPATLFKINRRGFIRKGYFADLVLVDPGNRWTVESPNILSKCGWSPFEGQEFNTKVTHTFVNGNLVYDNGTFNETHHARAVAFNA
jgi:dihydroorotase